MGSVLSHTQYLKFLFVQKESRTPFYLASSLAKATFSKKKRDPNLSSHTQRRPLKLHLEKHKRELWLQHMQLCFMSKGCLSLLFTWCWCGKLLRMEGGTSCSCILNSFLPEFSSTVNSEVSPAIIRSTFLNTYKTWSKRSTDRFRMKAFSIPSYLLNRVSCNLIFSWLCGLSSICASCLLRKAVLVLPWLPTR